MNGTKLITVAALIVVSLGATCLAQDPPEEDRGYGSPSKGSGATDTRSKKGPHQGLWRIDPDTKRAPEELVPTTDPYGFAAILNQYRAAAGLAPLAYDHELSAWAAQNNVAQSNRGIGHHVTINCYQNCAWNTPDAASTAEEWMNSRGHRANMLTPSATRFGIAYGPGPYWTMNAK